MAPLWNFLRRQRHASNRGFTVVEILVSLTIIGILVKIAFPNVLAWLPALRLSSAARQIATDLQLARVQAIAKNSSQTVTFNVSGGSYSFGSESRSLPLLFPGITISSATNPTFTPRGTANSVTITLSNGSNQKLVCVKSMGRVAIRSTTCS
jgi:prepilin-type N-terminal cleavage/methylation domain-containing protein